MSFLDARWRNGYAVAGDETTISNGTHTAAINRKVRPGVQPCTLGSVDGDVALRYDLWPADKEVAGTIARVQTEFTSPSWVTSMTTTKWMRWQWMLPTPWTADDGSGLTICWTTPPPAIPVSGNRSWDSASTGNPEDNRLLRGPFHSRGNGVSDRSRRKKNPLLSMNLTCN